MSSKNRVSVNLSEEEFSALSQLAERSKLSMAWLGRKAISDLLEQAKDNDAQLPLNLPAGKQRAN
ncbi:CopG family transcriptional regulator [Rhizobium ruizarguesonis]